MIAILFYHLAMQNTYGCFLFSQNVLTCQLNLLKDYYHLAEGSHELFGNNGRKW